MILTVLLTFSFSVQVLQPKTTLKICETEPKQSCKQAECVHIFEEHECFGRFGVFIVTFYIRYFVAAFSKQRLNNLA